MGNLNLNNFIEEYAKLQEQEAEIKAKKDALKEQIINEMGNDSKYCSDNYTATVTIAEGFKYTDEVAMINILKENGYSTYVKEKIDTSFNKLLKDKTPLTESLSGLYQATLTTKLSVKGNK